MFRTDWFNSSTTVTLCIVCIVSLAAWIIWELTEQHPIVDLTLPPERLPAASGLNNFLRITATGFATSLITTYWDRRERFHQSRLVESLSVFDPSLREVTQTLHNFGLSEPGANASVLNQVINQGFLLSSLDLFYFSGIATLVLMGACWLVRRPAASQVVGGAE